MTPGCVGSGYTRSPRSVAEGAAPTPPASPRLTPATPLRGTSSRRHIHDWSHSVTFAPRPNRAPRPRRVLFSIFKHKNGTASSHLAGLAGLWSSLA
eukprot:1178870-Prorocentrum_minimum.AAC.2